MLLCVIEELYEYSQDFISHRTAVRSLIPFNLLLHFQMPITPIYDWSETKDALTVQVQIQGAARSKTDVFAADCLLKINSPPYLLIVDLFGFVDEKRTVATITPEGVTFRLSKTEKCRGLWGQLEASCDGDEDKAKLVQRRNESVDRAHARIETARRLRLERVKMEEREATDRQIQLERRRRQEIEKRKKQELEEEKSRLLAWQKDMYGADGKAPSRVTADDSDYEEEEEEGEKERRKAKKEMQAEALMPDHPDYHGKGWRATVADRPVEGGHKKGPTATPTFDDDDDHEEGKDQGLKLTIVEEEDKEDAMAEGNGGAATAASFMPLPPPRIRLEPVSVNFTKLETGHLPARAQREEEIKLHKKAAREDKLLMGGDSVDVSDRQPVFLKDKGDGLYKQGNYRGAINAYRRAVEIDPDTTPAIWSNMAACHLQLAEHDQCAGCCTKAIDMLRARIGRLDQPDAGGASDELKVSQRQLVKALARRGQALASLDILPQAEADYAEAIKYDADNAALLSDLEELRLASACSALLATRQGKGGGGGAGEGSSATAYEGFLTSLRERAGARFLAKDYEGAAEAFSRLISVLPPPVASTSISVGPSPSFPLYESGSLASQASPSVPNQTDHRLASLSNRAACYLVLEKYEEAVSDCSEALHLVAMGAGLGLHTRKQVLLPPQGKGVASERDDECLSSSPLLNVLVKAARERALLPALAASSSRVLARRGAALAHLKRFAESAQDYETAAELVELSSTTTGASGAGEVTGSQEMQQGEGGGGGTEEGHRRSQQLRADAEKVKALMHCAMQHMVGSSLPT